MGKKNTNGFLLQEGKLGSMHVMNFECRLLNLIHKKNLAYTPAWTGWYANHCFLMLMSTAHTLALFCSRLLDLDRLQHVTDDTQGQQSPYPAI